MNYCDMGITQKKFKKAYVKKISETSKKNFFYLKIQFNIKALVLWEIYLRSF